MFCSLLCSYQKLINLYLMALTFTFPLMTRRCVRVTPPHTSRPTRKKDAGEGGGGGLERGEYAMQKLHVRIRTEKKGKCSASGKENFSNILLLLHVKGRAKEKAADLKACILVALDTLCGCMAMDALVWRVFT